MERKFMEHPHIQTENFRLDGIQYLFSFPNGYGASVLRNSFTYGGKRGLYELAVIFDGDLCYDTEITDDVLGYLTVEDVLNTLEKIKKLGQK